MLDSWTKPLQTRKVFILRKCLLLRRSILKVNMAKSCKLYIHSRIRWWNFNLGSSSTKVVKLTGAWTIMLINLTKLTSKATKRTRSIIRMMLQLKRLNKWRKWNNYNLMRTIANWTNFSAIWHPIQTSL